MSNQHSGSANAKRSGLSFEWAVASALLELLPRHGAHCQIEIERNDHSELCQRAFESYVSREQHGRLKSARTGVEHIASREAERLSAAKKLVIRLQADGNGKDGDVRDVVVTDDEGISLGISCKNNHEDFKHPRLSGTADFVRNWNLGRGCTEEYWNQVNPIFDELRRIKEESASTAQFADIGDLREGYLWPVLNAFEAEIKRQIALQDSGRPNVATQVVRYVIGVRDFYKLIRQTDESLVVVQAFNFGGTLRGRRSIMPETLIDVEDLSPGSSLVARNDPTKVLTFDRGYAFSFRLHNGDGLVRPSLKLAVGAVGLPAREIYTTHLDDS